MYVSNFTVKQSKLDSVNIKVVVKDSDLNYNSVPSNVF